MHSEENFTGTCIPASPAYRNSGKKCFSKIRNPENHLENMVFTDRYKTSSIPCMQREEKIIQHTEIEKSNSLSVRLLVASCNYLLTEK